jgi:hypothetical protein
MRYLISHASISRVLGSLSRYQLRPIAGWKSIVALKYQHRGMAGVSDGVAAKAAENQQRHLQFLLSLKASENDKVLRKLTSDPALGPHFDAILAASPPLAATDAKEEEVGENIPVDKIPKPTFLQLQRLAVLSGIPFIGFGFLDNALMILAGDFFDSHLGTLLGITTLAAAGMGNMVGDVLGICLGGTIESVAMRLGLPDPLLTAHQRKLNVVIVTKTAASIVGILIGMSLPSSFHFICMSLCDLLL